MENWERWLWRAIILLWVGSYLMPQQRYMIITDKGHKFVLKEPIWVYWVHCQTSNVVPFEEEEK